MKNAIGGWLYEKCNWWRAGMEIAIGGGLV
jgi:hypothetical protein